MRHFFGVGVCVLASAFTMPANADIVPLDADGAWHGFTLDAAVARSGGVEWIAADNTLDPAYGSPLVFSFVIDAGFAGQLTVLDTGFAGDRFAITDNGLLLGSTADVARQSFDSAPFEFDPALAFGNAAFSRGTIELDAGTHGIGGRLLQSVLGGDLAPLNATSGAVRLQVAAVPEPASLAMLLAGLVLVGVLLRRRLK